MTKYISRFTAKLLYPWYSMDMLTSILLMMCSLILPLISAFQQLWLWTTLTILGLCSARQFFSIYLRIINCVKLELETHQLNESWGPTLNHGHVKSATSPWALRRRSASSARSLPRCLERCHGGQHWALSIGLNGIFSYPMTYHIQYFHIL